MLKDKIDYPLHINQWKEASGAMAAYCRSMEISLPILYVLCGRLKKNDPV